jgi:diguanylate cyclase
LHYQAQVDIFSSEIMGFEALVRWNRPGKGMVSPADFIPLAEETGIIMNLGEWVLRRACTDAVGWPSPVRVAVNVSPAQFKDRKLAQVVARILQETGLPASRLELEITESLLLKDVEENLNILQELKNLGIRISMDDFGTGYSSLSSLSLFPLDILKMDRSLLAAGASPVTSGLASAVLSLGETFQLEVVAEGIEFPEQSATLRQLGCDTGQGFYFARPMPPEHLMGYLNGPAGDSASVVAPTGSD